MAPTYSIGQEMVSIYLIKIKITTKFFNSAGLPIIKLRCLPSNDSKQNGLEFWSEILSYTFSSRVIKLCQQPISHQARQIIFCGC